MSAECTKCGADLVYGDDGKFECPECTKDAEIERLKARLERAARLDAENLPKLNALVQAVSQLREILGKDGTMVECAQRLKDRALAAEGALAQVEGNRPYWLWRAMLEEVAGMCWSHDVDGAIECKDTGDCITGWCPPCAAFKFLEAIRKDEDDAALSPAPQPQPRPCQRCNGKGYIYQRPDLIGVNTAICPECGAKPAPQPKCECKPVICRRPYEDGSGYYCGNCGLRVPDEQA